MQEKVGISVRVQNFELPYVSQVQTHLARY